MSSSHTGSFHTAVYTMGILGATVSLDMYANLIADGKQTKTGQDFQLSLNAQTTGHILYIHILLCEYFNQS